MDEDFHFILIYMSFHSFYCILISIVIIISLLFALNMPLIHIFLRILYSDKNHGINFYGVTVQNKPEFPAQWDACAYDYYSEGEFIANHLGPELAESHPDTKLLIFDHNKDHIVDWAGASSPRFKSSCIEIH